MNSLQNKKIILGISGGIAAYKTPDLVRRLKEQGADVRVIMTQGAQTFITPLTLQAVSANTVADSLLDTQAELAMSHIELAKWADLLLIAPATADIIAKISCGLASNLLSTVCLATSAPIAIAPAMNQQMWHAQATQANIATLKSRNIAIFGPGAGEQACGDVGLGRMLEVNELVDLCLQHFIKTAITTTELTTKLSTKTLIGQHWVITAGPTREAIDPVRYISNYSSGKMGYALAQAALNAGATVSLISGPVNIQAPLNCELIKVNSAQEMHQQALELNQAGSQVDVFIACAAVADYRLDHIKDQKIKKSDNTNTMQLNLIKNPDIVADVAKLSNKPFIIGFAAETQHIKQYALAKLKRKNLDLIAANNVAQSGQGFNSDNNALQVFSTKQVYNIPLASKAKVAEKLIKIIMQLNNKK